jgi:polyhydroxybutyrate depolymerase
MYEQQFYITTDGGHSWPGGMQTVLGDPTSEFIMANDLMWDFFQLYSLECEPSAVSALADLKLKISPNPTKNSITIELPSEISNEGTVRILDINGQLLFSKKVNSNLKELDLSVFPAGIYFLHFQNKDLLITERIVKSSR